MKTLAKIVSVSIAFAASVALALNVGYLPSDAQFRTALSKEDWSKILENEEQPATLPYWIGGGMLCGNAGQGALVFEKLPTELRVLVGKVLEDQELWEQDEGDGRLVMEGPLFVFTANDFDLSKHSILNSYNPNRESELSLYESGKSHAKRLAEHQKKRFPISENPPGQFGALLPFDPKTAELGHEYDGTAKPPEDYQVFAISNAYAILLEELDGKKKVRGKAYQLSGGKISVLRYSEGSWKPNEPTNTEQVAAEQPATASESK